MSSEDPAAVLPGIDAHPHARAVLGSALAPPGHPSHAYLFHGPSGTGKRTVARAFAAALLSDGGADRQMVARRVERGSHPDLTWVIPSGAAEMLVSDVDEPVIAAATRTPFESSRRVFVIEGADTMNDQAANRLLKTLEEPAPFVHLLLLADRPEDLLATVVSRCQAVRFDPLPSEQIAARVRAEGVGEERALACARLALGDARLARELAGEQGEALRAAGESLVRGALQGQAAQRPWIALLEAARAAGELLGRELSARDGADLELLPASDRRRHEREAAERLRRGERRARTRSVDLALCLGGLWLRDLACVADGAPEIVHAVDRRVALAADASGRSSSDLRVGLALVEDTRRRLDLNVSEELALEALTYRLEELLGPD